MATGLTFERGTFEGLPFRLHVPRLGPTQRAPLILFLHGAGERGSDNDAQISYRFFSRFDGLFGPATRAALPCFILAPQAPNDDAWVAVRRWSDPQVTLAPQPTPALTKALALLDDVVQNHPVDAKRVVLTGLSMGAFGCFDAAARRPGTFKAVVAICGNGDPAIAPLLATTPFWLAHGAKDPLVPATGSRIMAEALRATGGTVTHKEFADEGHDVWDRAFGDHELVSWIDQALS